MRRNNRNNNNNARRGRRRRGNGRRNNPEAQVARDETYEERRSDPRTALWIRPSEFRRMRFYTANQTITIRRQTNLASITTSTSDTIGAYAFTLSSLPSTVDFYNLFDSYKIVGIRLTFISKFTDIPAGFASSAPLMYFALDYDDATPIGINALQQYDSVIVKRAVSEHLFSIVLKPKCSMGAWDGAAIQPAAEAEDQWLDIANPTIPHYGVKYAVQATATGVMTVDVTCDYYVQFKGVR